MFYVITQTELSLCLLSLLLHSPKFISCDTLPATYLASPPSQAMSIFMQSFRRKVTHGHGSNTLLLKTIVITSVTTLVSAFSFLKSSEHQRSSVKFLQYTRVSSSHDGPRRHVTSSISSHSKSSRLAAMVAPNTTFCECGESKVHSTTTSSTATGIHATKNGEHTTVDDHEKIVDDITTNGDEDSTYYYEKMKDPPRNLVDGHAIFGALLKPGYIERYDTYRRVPLAKDGLSLLDKSAEKDATSGSKEVCVADVRIGESLNGHAGIVHGGIISLILDDTLGWGYEALQLSSRDGSSAAGSDEDEYSLVVTANLTVNYRKPLRAGSNFVVRVCHEKTEGRKIYFTARIESYDGKTLYAEASSLFLKVKKEHIFTSVSSKERKN